jgi:hypothetical protein
MLRKTVGIVGRDFCGSTMLLKMLSCLEGVQAGGEMHWLIDVPVGQSITTRAGWPVTRRCVVHGDSCEALTPAFVDRPHAPETLYDDVAEAMGADILVSADKMVFHYERFVKPGQLEAIVLFKGPQAQVASDMRNERRGFFEALDLWVMTYQRIIEWVLSTKYPSRTSFVSYERLASHPEAMLKAICTHHELPEPPEDLVLRFESASKDKKYHCIGGSPHSHDRPSVAVDTRWKEHLKEGQKRLCDSGPAAILRARLDKLSLEP